MYSTSFFFVLFCFVGFFGGIKHTVPPQKNEHRIAIQLSPNGQSQQTHFFLRPDHSNMYN